jgi:GWxTD domain-containing protein
MTVSRSYPVLAGLVLGLVLAPAARADKMDKDSKKWMEEVQPIMLEDEEKTFKDLKDRAERDEFQKIFWARRNPEGAESPENPFKGEYTRARRDAEIKFKAAGGANSDCGRVQIVLGAPDDVKSDTRSMPATELSLRRPPETWIYRDRPGLKFAGGEIEIAFEEGCQLPPGNRMGSQLKRVAEGKVVNPSIDYRKTASGKLVPLVDLLPKPTPVMALLKEPRQDFPANAETNAFLRSAGGATYVVGLVRVQGTALSAEAGKTKAVVGVQAMDGSGKAQASTEREVVGEVGPDGSFVASYGVALKPGDYTLRVGVLDPKSNKGAVAEQPLKAPDYAVDELSLSPVLVLRDVQTVPPNPQDPMAAYQFGDMRMLARFGNTFTKEDAVTLLAFIYNPKVDEATGKPSTSASFVIMKDGKPLARGEEVTYDTPGAGPSVGPVPLTNYQPGKYVVQVKVRDNVAKKDYQQEATFEVK